MSYRVEVAPAPEKFLERLRDQSLKRRLIAAMRKLEENPRPPGSLKMQGGSDLHRVRVGDYRIIYEIRDMVLVVVVVKIGDRRDIDRG